MRTLKERLCGKAIDRREVIRCAHARLVVMETHLMGDLVSRRCNTRAVSSFSSSGIELEPATTQGSDQCTTPRAERRTEPGTQRAEPLPVSLTHTHIHTHTHAHTRTHTH